MSSRKYKAFSTPKPPSFAQKFAAASKIQKAFRSSKFAAARGALTRRNDPTVFINTKMNSIFSDRSYVKVQSVANFFVAAATAAGQYYFTILANSYYQPFNSGTPYSGAANGSATNSTGGSTTDSPSGYNDAVSYYTYYKVHKFLIEVECMPTNNADPINLTIANYCTSATSNISTFAQQEIAESAWACSRLCQNGLGPNKLSKFVDCRKLLGERKVQYQGQGPISIAAAPTGSGAITTGVRWETANNSTLTGSLVFQVKLTQWVELMVPDVLNAV